MIFSENRFTLFRIMLWALVRVPRQRPAIVSRPQLPEFQQSPKYTDPSILPSILIQIKIFANSGSSRRPAQMPDSGSTANLETL